MGARMLALYGSTLRHVMPQKPGVSYCISVSPVFNGVCISLLFSVFFLKEHTGGL